MGMGRRGREGKGREVGGCRGWVVFCSWVLCFVVYVLVFFVR